MMKNTEKKLNELDLLELTLKDKLNDLHNGMREYQSSIDEVAS